MNVAQIIAKKRDGGELSAEELGWLVNSYVRDEVAEYQMSAWAMAVYLRGMTTGETALLTEHMLRSGVTLAWSSEDRPCVDKHSTGGVGDKVSLILAPLLACCNLRVPMISGRGLGTTGGTLDKLEAIPGFRTDLSVIEMQQIVRREGCVISGASTELAPADRKLYALRDVTGTVPSIPLITASIMSKKLAEGLDALVLDVKCGTGAFMKTMDGARRLAQTLVDTATRMGVPTTALVTDMNQPLGRMVGNAVEVNEAVETLSGGGPPDVRELTIRLGSELLQLTGTEPFAAAARDRLGRLLDSGDARERFRGMIAAQGGDLDAIHPVAAAHTVQSDREGFVTRVAADQLGQVVIELGGGRRQIGDLLNHSTGLEMLVRVGERIERGQPVARIFSPAPAAIRFQPHVLSAIQISDSPTSPMPLVVESIHPSKVGQAAAQREALLQSAFLACRRAHAPYSGFHVGAALLTAEGKTYTAANVENKSYGLTICAERVALSQAVTAGERRFIAMAVATPGGVTPCGACRQFMAEFCGDLTLLLYDTNTNQLASTTSLAELLPHRFE
jgi:homotetrameric cytidine deaminase